jgi:glycosyltransferase involved in cell wall biosynthesis
MEKIYNNPFNNSGLGLVSIIIPTYNRYELLHHAIRSVLANTYKNIEIIVINDCSTDIRYYSGELEKYEKTKIIHLPVNQRIESGTQSAQGLTKNYGIKEASGEWLAFLDDDDFYNTIKLELQLKFMEQNKCLFSSSNMYLINHKSVSIDKLDISIIKLYFEKGSIPNVLTKEIIERNNFINNSSVVIHRSIVEKTGLFKAIKHEDYDYWKRALKYTDCYYIDIPLFNYTWTIENKSNTRFYTVT